MKFTPTASILFPSAEFVREKMLGECAKIGSMQQNIVIDCDRIQAMDYTAAQVMNPLKKKQFNIQIVSPMHDNVSKFAC